MNHTVLHLVRRYQREAASAFEELRSVCGEGSFLEAVHEGRLPKRGELASGVKYSFHGSGCAFEHSDGRFVDVDFGPKERIDGFDAWRLHQLSQTLEEYRELTLDEIDIALNDAAESGEIQQLKQPPSPSLFYFIVPEQS